MKRDERFMGRGGEEKIVFVGRDRGPSTFQTAPKVYTPKGYTHLTKQGILGWEIYLVLTYGFLLVRCVYSINELQI